MEHSYHHAGEKLWMALRRLTGTDSQRMRLENAYLDHLSYLQESEIPEAQQIKFSQLRNALTHGKQLRPEVAIEAMTDEEVGGAVDRILELYYEITSHGVQ